MSRPVRIPAGASLALLLAVPVAAGAQHAAEGWRDSALRVVAHYDSLRSERDAAVRAARLEMRRQHTWVEVKEGAFIVRSDPRLADRVRAAAREASALVDRRGGAPLRRRLATRTPEFGADSGRTRSAFTSQAWRARTWFRQDSAQVNSPTITVANGTPATVEDFRITLVDLAERVALDGADSALVAWLTVPRLPLRDAAAERWSQAYVELVTTASSSVRACRAGLVAGCLTSLGITSAPAARLDAWYDAADYRDVLARVAVRRTDSAAVASAERCRASGDVAACSRAAHAIPPDRVPYPLSSLNRQLFVEEVLRAGGSGAYERMIEAHGPIVDRLAAAANAPLDTVVSRWMARLDAARPSEMAVTPGTVAFTLAWCGVFMGIAIVRRGSWS